MNMNNDHKSVYAAAAEVVGMTLALLTGKEMSAADVEQSEQYTDDVVKQLMDKKPDRLITCLHCIQLHFPAIADRFSSHICAVNISVEVTFVAHFLLLTIYNCFSSRTLEAAGCEWCYTFLWSKPEMMMNVDKNETGYLDAKVCIYCIIALFNLYTVLRKKHPLLLSCITF